MGAGALAAAGNWVYGAGKQNGFDLEMVVDPVQA